MIKSNGLRLLLVIAGISLFSCNATNNSELENEINELRDSQTVISKKMASLEKAVNNLALASKNKPNDKNKPPQADPNKDYNVPVGDSFTKGPKDAAVTIIEWSDFQWPHCARSVSLVDDILKKYPNDVRVVIKQFPLSFHKQAKKASMYALAAERQGKYIEMSDLILFKSLCFAFL